MWSTFRAKDLSHIKMIFERTNQVYNPSCFRCTGAKNTVHAYLHVVHAYLHVVHAYLHVVHAYLHVVHAYLHVVHAYLHVVHAYLHVVHAYLHVVHEHTAREIELTTSCVLTAGLIQRYFTVGHHGGGRSNRLGKNQVNLCVCACVCVCTHMNGGRC